MTVFLSVLISLAIMFLIYILISFFCFKKIFSREKNSEKSEENFYKFLHRHGYRNLEEKIKNNKKNFENIDYKEVDVLSIDNYRLCGRLYLNGSTFTGRSVILCHGLKRSGETDFGTAFKMYREMNYNILVIDQRAHGGSEGNYSSMGIMESYDIVEWCKWLEMGFGTENDIIIHGVDMGAFAAVASGVNPEMPQNVKGIIADSIYPLIRSAVYEGVKLNLSFLAKPVVAFINVFFKNHVGFDMRDLSLYTVAKSEKIPVLFIHSETDSVSPLSNVESVMKRVPVKAQMITVKEAPHSACFASEENLCADAVKNFIGDK